jgi:F-type H+-transporting ATPase subunit c
MLSTFLASAVPQSQQGVVHAGKAIALALGIGAATSGDVTKAGKAIALALGIGLGSLGAGIGIGNIFGSMIQSVARQPELRGELQGLMWLGFALTEAVVFYGFLGGLLGYVLV